MTITFDIIDRTTRKAIITCRFPQNANSILNAFNKSHPNRYYCIIVKRDNKGEVINEHTDWL